ncbi:hypothetical protein SAMN05216490_0564 [Mucilaginibacter mallensis]|uniref:HEPN AbiU2-like domain-containing protein n=1 Tax=Mucilaginibacter mallensis TaxID=652787 RepID=A0A1H1PKN7_MUCMA|nr:hypothetical protein [Mucilaginibacter mallensis]SDS11309.1 hypothetical protein SAMN05216490_0564 [Mucilaginibacter mallensis]
MDNNLETVNNITDKLDWGIRSLKKIQISNHDKLEIQDNFWSFLTAFQNAWNYYNHLIALKNPSLNSKQRNKVGIELIENWKKSKLSDQEIAAWDILNKLRNTDTHLKPVKPEIIERELMLVTDMGFYLVDDQGRFLSAGAIIKYYIYFNEAEHDIIELAEHGVSAIKKLIDFIPTLV